MIPIDPRYLDAVRWTSQTSLFLVALGTVPVIRDEAEWQTWARLVTGLPRVSSLNPPRPELFTDWRAWAFQFNQAIELLTD